MSSNLHDDLAEVMKGIQRMTAVDLAKLFQDDARLREYVVGDPVRIRVAQQVDFAMDALIRDGELGSLGLVHRIDAETDVRKKIDEAAYLRHLLIEETRSTENVNRPPYAVEVVFAVMGDDVPNLADTLRTILRDGMYLHAVGVNLWRPENGSLTDAAAVRRAFSWLLAETENWFATRPSAAGSGEVLRRIALNDLRIAGPRIFELRRDHQLHIVHGHNGSGKSSLSEALELLATGKVARLEGQDHSVCLASRDVPNGTATIEVKLGRKHRNWTVGKDGITDPLGVMNPNAFRLDQTVADRLTHSSAADRARLFLSAFFEVESKGLRERNKLLSDATTHFANLPPRIAGMIGKVSAGNFFDDATARTQLQWLAEPATTTWEKFLELMPLTKTQVHDLGAMLPREIGERYQQTGPASADDLQKTARALDEAFGTLVPELDQRKETLTNAVAVLEYYGSAGVGDDAEGGDDLPVLLRRWMRLHARTDLLERQARIAETVYDAIRRGSERESLSSLLAAIPPDLESSRMQRDEARGRVISFVSAAEAAVLAAAAALEPLPANPPNVDALTAAATLGVFGEDLRQARPALGQALRVALAQGHPVQVQAGSQSITVGTQGWGRELLAKAKAALGALTQLAESRAELPVAPRTLEALLPTLRELHKAATQIGKIDAEDVQHLDTLFAEKGELRQALNELTALFTPARWGYRDVIPAADLKSSEQRLDLQAYGISAKFLLNTAELNTLALAIFLLCSRRAENPLRTLVLDDPLQNMDELTVTTIARGLARLLRLWKRHLDTDGSPWRLFLLLHGEDDVERIRGEVPCDVHLLPWLSPTAASASADGTVPVSTSLMKDELQTLKNVIEAAKAS
jgi:hypothetical protein